MAENLLANVFMGVGQGLSGQPFLTNYQKLKQEAEQWREGEATRVAQAEYMKQQAMYQQALAQNAYLENGFVPSQSQAPVIPPNAMQSNIDGSMGDINGIPVAPAQKLMQDANAVRIQTPYGEMVQQPGFKEESAQQARLKNNDYFNKANKLRDDFNSLSKPFRETRDAYARIQASAKDPSAAGDLALIFNYMKTLDPGSTVREGEFATAQNSGSVPDRVQAMYNNVIKGTRLAPEQRKDFVSRAAGLYKSQADIQQKQIDKFTQMAERYGLEPQDVVTDLMDFKEESDAPLKVGGEYNGHKILSVKKVN